MRDSYRSSFQELMKLFEEMPLEERKKIIDQANQLAPFIENTVDSSDYKFICKIIETLQSPGDPNPVFLKANHDNSYYSVNMCNVNTGHFLSQNKDYSLVRGFKVYQASENSSKEIVGFKATVHFVTVNKQGSYYDPTPDDDPEYLFVPSSRVYSSENDDMFWRRGIKLGAVVYGDAKYKKYVYDVSKIENANYSLVFENPDDMVIMEIVKPGSKVTINGLKSKPELNGTVVTLGKFNIEKRRWEVNINEKNILLNHSNITI